jgi:predicted transposase/invertase (TIGR01784 family)
VLDTAHAEGKLEGIQEGIAEGEAKAKLQLAKQFKAEGIALDVIMRITGLSQQQIED